MTQKELEKMCARISKAEQLMYGYKSFSDECAAFERGFIVASELICPLIEELEKVKTSIRSAFEDTSGLYYANVLGDVEQCLTDYRKKVSDE